MSLIYTIGYEGTDIDRFVTTLKNVGIEMIADVRALPLSRKRGFSKKSLAARLFDEGIGYTHFGELGDPKPGRDAAKSGRYDEFRSIYNAHLATNEAQNSLEELVMAADTKASCLLCFERDPKTCHRSIVAQEMSKNFDFRVFDLFGDDPTKYVRNADRMPRYHSRESASAA